MDTNSKPKEITMSAVVIRADGTRVDLGVVSYYHKNPVRRLWWRLNNRSK